MKIDIWTHILSPSYLKRLERSGQQGSAAFLTAQRALHDVDWRRSLVDAYPGYRQVLDPIPCRLMFAGIYDRHPNLKLIVHHGGGLIPHLSAGFELIPRAGNLDSTGRLEEQLGRLQRQPAEYLKMIYVDTAMFGAAHAVRCVVDFFGPDRVMFGSDAPFDTEGGTHFIPATISDVEHAAGDPDARAAIFHGNAERILGVESDRLRPASPASTSQP